MGKKKFSIHVEDSAYYIAEASTAEEAKEMAWDWFDRRRPIFEVKEIKGDDNKKE